MFNKNYFITAGWLALLIHIQEMQGSNIAWRPVILTVFLQSLQENTGIVSSIRP
jgi:hypothetical protein